MYKIKTDKPLTLSYKNLSPKPSRTPLIGVLISSGKISQIISLEFAASFTSLSFSLFLLLNAPKMWDHMAATGASTGLRLPTSPRSMTLQDAGGKPGWRLDFKLGGSHPKVLRLTLRWTLPSQPEYRQPSGGTKQQSSLGILTQTGISMELIRGRINLPLWK